MKIYYIEKILALLVSSGVSFLSFTSVNLSFFFLFHRILKLSILMLSLTMEVKTQDYYQQKIRLNKTRRNHYVDSHCILTVIVPEMVTQAICCKKNHFE